MLLGNAMVIDFDMGIVRKGGIVDKGGDCSQGRGNPAPTGLIFGRIGYDVAIAHSIP